MRSERIAVGWLGLFLSAKGREELQPAGNAGDGGDPGGHTGAGAGVGGVVGGDYGWGVEMLR